jgi:hypothetical protein
VKEAIEPGVNKESGNKSEEAKFIVVFAATRLGYFA